MGHPSLFNPCYNYNTAGGDFVTGKLLPPKGLHLYGKWYRRRGEKA